MLDKEKLLRLLKGYENSMTEFEPEEMAYIRALVNFDRRNTILNDEDIEYWKDYELPEETGSRQEWYRTVEYLAKMKKLMIEDLLAMEEVKVIND